MKEAAAAAAVVKENECVRNGEVRRKGKKTRKKYINVASGGLCLQC